jgi:thioredoxin reductase
MNIDDKVINTLPVYLSGESLFEMTNKPSHVVVVGGGECALDYSLSLQSYGCDTHVLVRGSSLKAAARLIAEAERKKGIHFHFHTSVHGIYKGVLGVRVKIEGPSGCKELKTDAVMIAIGQESNAASLVRGLTVCSKERIATELSRLYIVGDARTTTLGQVGISVGDGIAAAMAVNRQLLRDESLKGKK